MRLPFLMLLLSLAAVTVRGQSAVDFANLREDVRLLSQRVGELSLRVEQLERENAQLRVQAGGAGRDNVTLAQLNEAVAEINRVMKASIGASRTETLETVARRMEQLAQQTDAAIQALAKGGGARGVAAPSFSGEFPKEGISYTVQKGDTVAIIAKRTGARAADIINANKLADPSLIFVGQVLFIPGGK